MKFLTTIKGCTRLEKIKHKDRRWKLNVSSVNGRLDDYIKNNSPEQNGWSNNFS